MRRRSEATDGGGSAPATEKLVKGAFLECACGLRQSASIVLKTGKCVRCSAPMSAPEGTPETFSANVAADHAAKNGFHVPLGERAETRVAAEPEGEDWVTSDAGKSKVAGKAPGKPVPTPEQGQTPDEFGPDPFGPSAGPGEKTNLLAPEVRSGSVPGPVREVPSISPAGFSFVRVFPSFVREYPSGAPMSGEEVLVTWPEEIIKLAEFCTVRVGPFSVGVKLREGEDRGVTMRGLYGELVVMAEAERDRKIESFRRILQRELPVGRTR